MDLETIKAKFRHKTTAEIQDLDAVLKALPMLVREVERLEAELRESERRIEHLQRSMRRMPPTSREGQSGSASWSARVDEKKNRLYIKLTGHFNFQQAQKASQAIDAVMGCLRADFDLINDISALNGFSGPKVVFHVRKMLYLFKEQGIGRVVRIVNPQAPNINSLFEQQTSAVGIHAQTAESVQAAENLLDNLKHHLRA